jgi:hypothetical protein
MTQQRDQVISDSKVVTLGAPDFIVTEFERDRQPVPPSEGEPDREWLHHVLGGDTIRGGGNLLFDGAGEFTPTGSQQVGEFVDVVVEGDLGRS